MERERSCCRRENVIKYPGSWENAPLLRDWETDLSRFCRRGVGTEFTDTAGRGHTPGWLLSAFGRFTFSPSPTVLKKTFRNWVGEALGPPAGIYTSQHLLNPARRGTGTASAAILEQPGPGGPKRNANRHSDFARRKFCSLRQVRVPRNGGPGVSRHGERSSPLRRPPAILWVLSHRWESTSPPGRRNLSASNEPDPQKAAKLPS